MSTTHNDDNTPAAELDDATRVLMQKYALDWAYAQHADLLDELKKDFSPGDRRVIKNSQGVELGALTMSNPSKKAVPVDPAVVAAQADEKQMEMFDTLPSADSPEGLELIQFLYDQGRTDLLGVPTVGRDDMNELAAGALEEWQVTGQAPAGWEIKDASRPSFTVRKVTGKKAQLANKAIAHLQKGMSDLLMLDTPGKDQ